VNGARWLLDRSRAFKCRLTYAVDMGLVIGAFHAGLALRYGLPVPETVGRLLWPLGLVVAGSDAVLLAVLQLHRIKLTAIEGSAILRIAAVSAGLAATAAWAGHQLNAPDPFAVPLVFAAVFFAAAVSVRVGGLHLLTLLADQTGHRRPVLIYGAGAAGIQLAAALRQSHDTRAVGFVDDTPALHGLTVGGLMVWSPARLSDLAERHAVRRILLAIPSSPRARQNALIADLSARGFEVHVLPSYSGMITGRGTSTTPHPVTPDALLGRDKVDLDVPEIARTYAGRVVMVTGAGGSVGAELCRQLIECKPARIVLFEHNEYALHAIDHELRPRVEGAGVALTVRLGSVTDRSRVAAVMDEDRVEIVLHAAAYKHVPLVEENALEGARNNVLCTQIVAEVAQARGVERFILISTDKAVRPTNVMGATKRMAELVVQDLQTRSRDTRFSMVRFGNVLGSSGSVLPLFRKQIEAGGPVTVTHPEVTRFFMTIPEAARLVLLAGAYSTGGDVFVLDMGQPRRILDIARKMITLSGRSVRDPASGAGDIEIRITGLRPGEKLREELLIDGASLRSTPHAKILRAEDPMLSQIEVAAMLRDLTRAIEQGDPDHLRRLIAARVEGYGPPDRAAL